MLEQGSSGLRDAVRAAARGVRLRAMRAARGGARLRVPLIALGCLAACSPGAAAKVLLVGPDRGLRLPSEAAAVAQDGDIVRFDPGEYVDCAIWRASGLVLEAPEGTAHVRDRACAGKAIWVIAGNDVTVDNITFSGARVPDQNGAGIRAEGKNLTVRNSRFYDNENGILAGTVEGSTILIEGSLFERNGKCAANCAHGVYVNQIERLKVVGSVFRAQQVGHHVKSGAVALEVIGSTIEDGPEGTASYLIDVTSGGEVVIADNQMQKGPKAENWGTAIHIAGEAAAPDGREYRISNNRFRSDNPNEVAFVRNRTVVPALLEGNRLEGNVVPLVGPGSVDSDQQAEPQAVARDPSKEGGRTASGDEPAAGPAALDDIEAKLRLLKRLFEEELITEEEYAAKRAQLLKSL
jgi:Right handed beta helix region